MQDKLARNAQGDSVSQHRCVDPSQRVRAGRPSAGPLAALADDEVLDRLCGPLMVSSHHAVRAPLSKFLES